MTTPPIDPTRDLLLERFVDVSPELVWRAWTEPEQIVKWFTPAPWTTPEAEVDLRPGGIFRTVMCSPEGERNDNRGCFLEIEPNRKLVWTAALGPGFRPNDFSVVGFPFTVELTLEPHQGGTSYTARVMHASPEHSTQHAEMGFAEGWGAAFDQMVAHLTSR